MRILPLKHSPSETPGSPLLFWTLILALALRILTLLRNDPVTFDSAAYFEMAEFLRAGRWSDSLLNAYPPLFPILIAALQRVGLSAENAGLLLALASNLVVLLMIVAITRRVAGERAACGAAFLWAIHPYAVRLGTRALSDAPTAFFVASSLCLGLWASERKRLTWAIGAGAASGLAYLTRPEGIEPALALAGFFLVQSSTRLHRRILWALAPIVGWAIIASPYVTYLSIESGSFTLSKKKSPAAMVHSLIASDAVTGSSDRATTAPNVPAQTLPQAEMRQSLSAEAPPVDARAQARESRLRKMARSVYLFQRPLVNGVHPVVLFFAAFAPWSLRPKKNEGDPRVKALLASLVILHFVVLVGVASIMGPDYLGGHHFFLMTLYLLPFAAAGLAAITDWLRKRLPALPWLTAAVLAAAILVTLPSTVFRAPERGGIMREGGMWIRQHASGRPVVATDVAKLTYHAGAERIPFSGNPGHAVRVARAQGAEWLAIYGDDTDGLFDSVQKILKESDLDLAAEFSETSGQRVYRLRIYRLRKTS